MSELPRRSIEHKLWYEGPNYTADAVIIDPSAARVLLIKRADTGEWALPGGFVDACGESSREAAIREAGEEATVELIGDAPLIFRGRIDDPRNTDIAWIETSAHLFTYPSTIPVQAGDDAKAAVWHELSALPMLYASHRQLIERALDYLDGTELFDRIESPDMRLPIEGGYMCYDKWIATKGNQTAFVKQRPATLPVDATRYDDMRRYLEKEAGVMAHLRQNGFKHVPERSVFRDGQLVMDSYCYEDGWQWQITPSTFASYLDETLTAFAELERIPLPPDVFDVESSYDSLIREGWRVLNHDNLVEKMRRFMPQIPPSLALSAHNLLADIPELYQLGNAASTMEPTAFCHHDIRQDNLAWHPTCGVRIVDWSWAGPGLPGSDSTGLLIDLHKSGYDVSPYSNYLNPQHCLNLLGFWLAHSTLPDQGANGLRLQQFISALSAYQLLL